MLSPIYELTFKAVSYTHLVLMFNNSRDAYAIAAKKMGFSLNPSSVEEVDDVMKELQAQKSVVQAYVMDEIFDKIDVYKRQMWYCPIKNLHKRKSPPEGKAGI